jgi:hypothetical protein
MRIRSGIRFTRWLYARRTPSLQNDRNADKPDGLISTRDNENIPTSLAAAMRHEYDAYGHAISNASFLDSAYFNSFFTAEIAEYAEEK